MRVIKSNTIDDEYPKRCECPNCSAELEYDREDEWVGIFGINFVRCPNCGYEIDVTDKDTKRLVKMTWDYTFAHTSSDNSVEVSDDNIQQMVDRVYDGVKNEKDGYFYTNATGNTLVVGIRTSDSTKVYVTKDYYEDVIFTD